MGLFFKYVPFLWDVLFHDYAILVENTFNIIRIERMINKTAKRKIEYKNPVNFDDDCVPRLELLCLTYSQNMSHYKLNTSSHIKPVMASNILCHVNLTYDNLKNVYLLPDVEKKSIEKEVKKLTNKKYSKKTQKTQKST